MVIMFLHLLTLKQGRRKSFRRKGGKVARRRIFSPVICLLSNLMLSLSSRNSSLHFTLFAWNECSNNQTNHILSTEKKQQQQRTGRRSRRFVPTSDKVLTFFLWLFYLNIFLSDMWITRRKIKSWRKKWKLFLP